MKRLHFEIPRTHDWEWLVDGIHQYCWLRELKPMIRRLKPDQYDKAASDKVVRIGGMDLMVPTWNQLGIYVPPLDYPLLEPFHSSFTMGPDGVVDYGNMLYGRRIERMRLSDFWQKHQDETREVELCIGSPDRFRAYCPPFRQSYFVKPVVTKQIPSFRYPIEPLEITHDTAILNPELWVSDWLPGGFTSEWRVYVQQGKVIGCCHYSGEHLAFPDPVFIQSSVRRFEAAKAVPICYAMDVGVRNLKPEPPTVIVEVNDFWALGNYGLDVQTYVQCCVMRWQQLVSQGNNLS